LGGKGRIGGKPYGQRTGRGLNHPSESESHEGKWEGQRPCKVDRSKKKRMEVEKKKFGGGKELIL